MPVFITILSLVLFVWGLFLSLAGLVAIDQDNQRVAKLFFLAGGPITWTLWLVLSLDKAAKALYERWK